MQKSPATPFIWGGGWLQEGTDRLPAPVDETRSKPRLVCTTSSSLGHLSPVFVWYILSAGGGRGPYTSGPCNELGHPTAAHPAQSPTKPGRQDPSGPTHPPATTLPPSITASTPCNAQYKALIQAIPLHCMPSPMKTPGGVHAPNSTLKYHRGPDRTDTVGVKKEKRGPTAQSQPPGSPHASLAQCLNSI